MSKASRDFFERARAGEIPTAPPIGVIEAAMEGVKEGVMAYREGLGKVWDALTPAFELGAEEVARSLFSHGSAYVFHGDTIPHEQSHQAVPIEAQKEVEDREI